MATILRPDHFTIVTDDLSVTENFYTTLLGFRVGPRPDFKFPGLWLYANDAAILHVMQVDEMPTPRKGVLDHMAFRGEDVNALLRKLKTAGLTYRIVRTPAPWDQWQVFFEDPNGAVVEVDFDGQEALEPEYQPSPL
ncbi:MAG: VOC family protein [Hyphomonadaceae bacterium]